MSSAALRGRFFLPGPVEVAPDVLAALTRPMISHLGPEMAGILARIQPRLQKIFRTSRPVLTATSSATGLLEGAIRAGVEHRVLVAVGGYFGERLARIAEACGKEVIRVMVPEGCTIEADHLARFLEGPDVDAVALVHSETSTGALAPLEELAAEVRRHGDVALLVDAVSSVGAIPVETDAWDLDFIGIGSQKALALPPGLAFGVASSRLMERARRQSARGWYFDLLLLEDAARENRPPQTPAIPLLFALDQQLARIEAEGLEARWGRHAELAAMVAHWCDAQPGCALLAPPGRRSWTVSAIRTGTSARAVVERLARDGWTVAPGLPPLQDSVVRIGHMGEVRPADLAGLLESLAAAIPISG
ncbi:MAG: pyridoxal-phosphate-dependent aminotransferase family protein [Bacillota bacterium]